MLKFGTVGGTSVATDLVCYISLLYIFELEFASAKACAYLMALTINFIGNKLWTFSSRRASLWEAILYFLVYGTSLLVNVGVNESAMLILGADFQVFGYIASVGVAMVINFIGLKCLAFRKRGAEESDQPPLHIVHTAEVTIQEVGNNRQKAA